MKKLSRLFLCFLLYVVVFSCLKKQPVLSPAEELKMIGMEMAKREHVEYQYTHKLFRSYDTGDTSYDQGKIYFETNPKDTAIGYNFYTWVPHYEGFYNGDHYIALEKRDSSASMKPLCDYQDGHRTTYPWLEKSYGAIKLFLTDTLFISMTDSLTRKDTVLNKQPCVMFSFWADNKLIDTHKKFEGRKKVVLIFLKNEAVPLLYATYTPLINWDGREYLYQEAAFSDYNFDVTYPSSIFAIEQIPVYYRWNIKLTPAISVGTKAPDWKLPDVNGDSVVLSDFQGKYVLLNFWFMGCGACIQSIPVLNELQSEYGDKLEVVGVNCFSKNVEAIRRYCINRGMNYTNVWNGDDEISKTYEIKAAPTFYLIDQNGVVVDALIGANTQKLKDMIDSVL